MPHLPQLFWGNFHSTLLAYCLLEVNFSQRLPWKLLQKSVVPQKFTNKLIQVLETTLFPKPATGAHLDYVQANQLQIHYKKWFSNKTLTVVLSTNY